MKNFEDMTIAELREQTEQFKKQNPDVRPAQEILEEINNKEE